MCTLLNDMNTDTSRRRSLKYSFSVTSSTTTTVPSAGANTVSGSSIRMREGERKNEVTNRTNNAAAPATIHAASGGRSHAQTVVMKTANAIVTKMMEYPSL